MGALWRKRRNRKTARLPRQTACWGVPRGVLRAGENAVSVSRVCRAQLQATLSTHAVPVVSAGRALAPDQTFVNASTVVRSAAVWSGVTSWHSA